MKLRKVRTGPTLTKESVSDVGEEPTAGKEPTARESSARSGAGLTWKDIARVFDAFMFRLYMIVILIITAIFFTVLGLQATVSGSEI